MQEIARCTKCGRKFVWVNPHGDKRDHFYPANKPLDRHNMPTDEECGGEIVALSAQDER